MEGKGLTFDGSAKRRQRRILSMRMIFAKACICHTGCGCGTRRCTATALMKCGRGGLTIIWVPCSQRLPVRRDSHSLIDSETQRLFLCGAEKLSSHGVCVCV